MSIIETDIDDLFRASQRELIPAPLDSIWITCRVCGLRSKVEIDNEALLCEPCREDLGKTAAFVRDTLAAVEARWMAAYEMWEANDRGSALWLPIAAAQGKVDPALFAEAWRRRRAQGGPLAELLLRKEALDELSDDVIARREWAERGEIEIDRAALVGRGE